MDTNSDNNQLKKPIIPNEENSIHHLETETGINLASPISESKSKWLELF